MTARALCWTLCGLVATGCLVSPPQLDDPAVQGDYEDGDVEHRPGQPCLLCHGPGHVPRPPGEVRFQVAGTVFGGLSDREEDGLAGVEVVLTDARGTEVTAVSNDAGNFMISVNSDLTAPEQHEPGWWQTPTALEFPLLATIRRDGEQQEMVTNIWRAGSCAHCHGAEPGVASVGRVALFPEGSP